MKVKKSHVSSIIMGMIASIVFCFVDSMIFLFVEDKLNIYWKKQHISPTLIPILNGGLSASIAIYASVLIGNHLKMKYDIFEHPLIDSLGMIIGTIIILLIYKIFLNNNNPMIKPMIKVKQGFDF